MERHFQRELEHIKTSIIKMSSIIEENFNLVMLALLDHNETIARVVIDAENRVNSLEIEIDNAIVDLLALQQPVASDLRFIIAAQKINNDLERIGDHAVNIAESALSLQKNNTIESLLEIPKMAALTNQMLGFTIDSFIHLDPKMARFVLETDDQVDVLNRTMTTEVIKLLRSDNRTIEGGLELIRISRNLERIADLTTNIAEEVIFYIQALVVKHHAEEFKNTILDDDK